MAERLGSLRDTFDDPGIAIAYGFFSTSTNGILVYRTGLSARNAQLTWIDRQGHTVSKVGDPAQYSSVALSPDGSRAAVRQWESETATQQLWIVDLGSGTKARFTFGPKEHCCPVWSPDGRRLAFGTEFTRFAPEAAAGESWQVLEKAANSSTEERALVQSNGPPWDWSRDGRFLLYGPYNSKTTLGDIWILPLEEGGKPRPFLANASNEFFARFSPDGHWVAHVSNESGQAEVYVREVTPDGAGGKWIVSKGGALAPRWRGDGKELFYSVGDAKLADGTLMAVDVSSLKGEFHAGIPKLLFKGVNEDRWDVTADGMRFLVAVSVEQASRTPFTVVQNWPAGLKK